MAFCHKNQTLFNAIEHSASQLGVTKAQARERTHRTLAEWEQKKVRSISPSEWERVSKAWNASGTGNQGK